MQQMQLAQPNLYKMEFGEQVLLPNGLRISFEAITPETAQEWIKEFNTHNRPIRAAHVKRLASDMAHNRWIGANGETVKFDIRGHLTDAQHRLLACIRSGVTIGSLVVRDVSVESYATVDIGTKKATSDFLKLDGYKNSTLLAAIAKLVYIWLDGHLSDMKSGDNSPTTQQVREMIKDDEERLTEAARFTAGCGAKDILTSSFCGLIHYAGSISNHNALACSFLERLGNGLGLRDYEPVYHLRKFLLANKSSRRKAGQPFVLALAIKAWNATKAEKSMSSLIFKVDEKFPQL